MSIPAASETNTVVQTTTQTELQQWRLQLLNGLMLTSLVIASPLVVLGGFNVLTTQPDKAPLTIGIYITVYLMLGINAFVRALPYVLRVIILLLVFYAVGFFDTFAYGLVSDGRLYMLTLCVVAALLLGIRSAVLMSALTVGTMSIIAWLKHQWVPTTINLAPFPSLWITQLLSQAAHSIVLLVCISVLLRQLATALNNTRSALHQAEVSAQAAQQQATTLAAQTNLLEQAQEQLQELVSTLETPTVELAAGVLLAPLTGRMDVRRAHAITERLLQKVHRSQTRLVILDLAGMPTADIESITALKTTAHALQLLGCQVSFTSLSAELAQNFQQADVLFEGFTFQRSPQEVLTNYSQSLRLPPGT